MIAHSLVTGTELKPLRVFYSYSRKSNAERAEVDDQLSHFTWDILVEPWYDGNIPVGDPWDETIHTALDSADVILLFVTNAFMNSDYCQGVELSLSLRKHEEGKARVIPIVFENTEPDWHKAPFAHLQVLPQNGLPVVEWPSRKEAVIHVCQALVNIITEYGVQKRPRKHKWKIQLEGELGDFTMEDESQIVLQLRQYTSDQTLRPLDITNGGITIVMESTDDALTKVLSGFKKGEIHNLLDWHVISIIELYGAGIQASSTVFSETDIEPPDILPSPDALLIPSASADAIVMTSIWIKRGESPNFYFGFDDVAARLQGRELTLGIQNRLIDFFWAGTTAKSDELWVNLAPDERNRMLPEYLAGTALGRAMIDSDYQMKQLCASLIHPESESGRDFWREVFALAQQRYGTAAVRYSGDTILHVFSCLGCTKRDRDR